MIDINLLRILKYKSEYIKYKDIVDPTITEGATDYLLNLYGSFFNTYPDINIITAEEFFSFFALYATSLSEEQKKAYRAIIARIDSSPNEQIKETMILRLSDLRLAGRILDIHRKFNTGEEIDILDSITLAKSECQSTRQVFAKEDFVNTKIAIVLKKEQDNTGLQWRLSCLQRSVKALRGGHFGILAARPDAGKTSFVASEVTNFALQLKPDENIVIFNNEGVGDRMLLRLYQAALNADITEIISMNKKGTLESNYIKAVGRLDKIRIINAHSYGKSKIERSLVYNNAGLVVFDMLDNIKSFNNLSDATHARLENLYQWGRELCIEHNIPGLATSQISVEGDGMLFPAGHMLKDSKTGKQGACDFILMIGKSIDITQEPFRYISLPKNKLHRPGAIKDPRAEVTFDAQRSIFCDTEERIPMEEPPK